MILNEKIQATPSKYEIAVSKSKNEINFFKQKLKFEDSLSVLFEIILFPLVIPMLLWFFSFKDIFLLETAFPWLIIAPTIISARYGTWLAIISLITLAMTVLLYTFFYQENQFDTALQILAGNLLLIVFVGEMLHHWKKKHKGLREDFTHFKQLNYKLQQELQVLHIAYSQLEENFVATMQSLSNSLRLLEVSLEPSLDRKQQVKLGLNKLNIILKEYDWIEESAFFYVDKMGEITPTPFANKACLLKDLYKDTLVVQAIKSKQAVIYNKNTDMSLSKKNTSELQAAIPLVDSRKHLWGVLAVIRLSPSTVQQQNLNLLNLLCTYVASLLSASQYPITSKEQLFLETSTSIKIALNSFKEVSLVRITIPLDSAHSKYKIFFTKKNKRHQPYLAITKGERDSSCNVNTAI